MTTSSASVGSPAATPTFVDSSTWDQQDVLDTLRELAKTYPDAEIQAVDETNERIAVPSGLQELFPGSPSSALPGLFSRSTKDSRVHIIAAWGRAQFSVGARCLIALDEAPDIRRALYVFNLIQTHGLILMVSPQGHVAEEVTAQGASSRPRRMAQVVDDSGRFRDIDENTGLVMGWDDSIIGRSSLDFMHPDDHERAIEAWIQLLDNPGSRKQIRLRYKRADGSWLWVDNINHNALDTDGCVFREMIDVSEEVEAISTARSREEVLRRLAGALPSGIIEWQTNGEPVFSNERWREITGLPSAPVDELVALALAPSPDELGSMVASSIEAGTDLDVDVTLVSAVEGAERHCRMSVRSIEDEHANIVGAVCCLDDVTEQWRLTQTLAKQASSDPLTELPNRVSIVDSLDVCLGAAERSGAMTAVMFFDLKGFKRINDRYGHAAGDELLQTVAASLSAALRPGDIVGRQGGDEFLVVCPQVGDVNSALRLAQRLQDAICMRFAVAGAVVDVRADCGVALDVGGENRSERLIAEADLAMYEQRRKRSMAPGLARPNMFAEQRRSLDRDDALREAHRDGSLELHYQPLVDIQSNEVVGFESLLRWRFNGELVPPDEFIGLAERRGLISDIGEWTIRELCRTAARHRDRDVFWTVNVSPLQLRNQQVISAFAKGLEEHGLDAASFGIELTEGVMVADSPDADKTLRRLHAMGLLLMVDDFGTGFASLDYLRSLPVGGLKVDRSFVNQLQQDRTRAIIETIAELAQKLDMYLVAEGIETPQQHQDLQDMGVSRGQGYLYGRPQPEPVFDSLWKP